MSSFGVWGEEQPHPYRVEFLREMRSRLSLDIQTLASETQRLMQARNESMRRGCGEIIDEHGNSIGWQLPLDETAKCAMDYLKSLFLQEFPTLWETKRFQVRQIFESQFDFCATFDE